jgi:hypothetical protein
MLVLLLLCAAPVPGDVGGCGQEPRELDPEIFFVAKKQLDCQRCRGCDLISSTCTRACNGSDAPAVAFPEGCVPVVHDGFVCLRALRYASCDEYATYVDDSAPSVPTECNFCPPQGP